MYILYKPFDYILSLYYTKDMKSHGQRSLAGHSLWGHNKSDMNARTHTHNLPSSFVYSCVSGHLGSSMSWLNSFFS